MDVYSTGSQRRLLTSFVLERSHVSSSFCLFLSLILTKTAPATTSIQRTPIFIPSLSIEAEPFTYEASPETDAMSGANPIAVRGSQSSHKRGRKTFFETLKAGINA